MNKFSDFVAVGLLMLLTVSNLVAFIKLIIIGDVALGACGIIAFNLFALELIRRNNE